MKKTIIALVLIILAGCTKIELPEPVTEGIDLGFTEIADKPDSIIALVGGQIVTMRNADRSSLHETSKNRIKNWSNTIDAQRRKREEDRIKRLEDEEVSAYKPSHLFQLDRT